MSAFGAAILGNVTYDDHAHNWLIKLGQIIANFEDISDLPEASLSQLKLNNLTEDIDNLLKSHTVPEVAKNTPRRQVAETTQLLVKAIRGLEEYALLLIGSCTWYLQEGLKHGCRRDSLRETAKDHLERISNQCPDLSVKVDALWDILEGRAAERLTTQSVRTLLVKLTKPYNVLVIAAEPRDAGNIRLGEECRELEDALRATKLRNSFKFHSRQSCRVQDITRALDEYNPEILQFAGHGNSQGLYFEDSAGKARVVEKSALAELLEQQQNLKLVVLNACYSQSQAQCIADSVGFLVAMDGKVGDRAAVIFTREFYTALGSGRTVDESFKRAKAALGIEGFPALQPRLLTRGSDMPKSTTNGLVVPDTQIIITRAFGDTTRSHWVSAILFSTFAIAVVWHMTRCHCYSFS